MGREILDMSLNNDKQTSVLLCTNFIENRNLLTKEKFTNLVVMSNTERLLKLQ